MMTVDELNGLSGIIIDAAMAVHTELGPGLLESAYENCLAFELGQRGRHVTRQLLLPIVFRSVQLEEAYRIDLLVENEIVVELKTIPRILPVHECQLLTYLRFSSRRLGLLINFHTAHLRDGIKRMVNHLWMSPRCPPRALCASASSAFQSRSPAVE